jgi:hypothetical protein
MFIMSSEKGAMRCLAAGETMYELLSGQRDMCCDRKGIKIVSVAWYFSSLQLHADDSYQVEELFVQSLSRHPIRHILHVRVAMDTIPILLQRLR